MSKVNEKSIGVIPYKNLVNDEEMKEYYNYYKPIINNYLNQFNHEIYDKNYEDAYNCCFKFNYILTRDGLTKLLVFCENTYKVTWKVVIEEYNKNTNTTKFTETEFYILEELTEKEYLMNIIKRYEDCF